MDLLLGDCKERLGALDNHSIDAVVTDPPYGLSFMGKKWDYDVPSVEIWREVFRVLKPGGHLLAFGGTRTYHRLVVAIEDAGFEIRDQVQWIYGQGFPKSLNISKAIEKSTQPFDYAEWDGWGTALKPANEPICLARKPLEKGLTVAQNVLKWGTGGLNIDGSRIEFQSEANKKSSVPGGKVSYTSESWGQQQGLEKDLQPKREPPQGRFPANVILDEAAGEMLDAQTGVLKNGGQNYSTQGRSMFGTEKELRITNRAGDSGGASRFFYCAKASTSERNEGLTDRKPEKVNDGRQTEIDNPFQRGEILRKNTHPTVKPIKLMEYLCRLITQPKGVILDPFMGSGSTGVAARRLGFGFTGIELNPEYFEIARNRILNQVRERIDPPDQVDLKDFLGESHGV